MMNNSFTLVKTILFIGGAFLCFCCFQVEIPQFDCSSVEPQTLLWVSDLEEIINIETSSEFGVTTVTDSDSLRICFYGMETEDGEDFIVDFYLWCFNDMENSQKANIESMVDKRFEFEEISLFDDAIYIKKLKTIIIKKDPFVIKVLAQGFSKWEAIEIGRTILERLPQ